MTLRSALETLGRRSGAITCAVYRVEDGIASPHPRSPAVTAPTLHWQLAAYPELLSAAAEGEPLVIRAAGGG